MDTKHAAAPEASDAATAGGARPTLGVRHRGAKRLRALVLGPRGGGVTRRRASDVVRLVSAVVVVGVSIPVARANTSVEVQLDQLLTPPPTGIRWLVDAVWVLGSVGVVAAVVLVGLLVPRLAAVRRMAIAAVVALVVCVLLDTVLGAAAGRPPIPQLNGVDAHYPVTQLALAMAVALTGLPYLSRPLHRVVGVALALAALSAVVGGYGLPVNVVASLAIGWGVAAGCHLAMGAPFGLLSADEVTEAVRDLRVDARGLVPMARQDWGVGSFTGSDEWGRPLEIAVYGRDAADAQRLSKLWRFCVYRDSGPTLVMNRLQQVEHEAYLTLLAAKAGVLVPEVVAGGLCGAGHDAALVTRLPVGRRLAELSDTDVTDDTIEAAFRAVLALRAEGIAHGALSPETLVVGEGLYLRDFRRASSSAPAGRCDRDLAAVVAAVAVVAGVERTVASAARVLDADTVQSVLTQLQRSTIDPATDRMARAHKGFLRELREALAGAAGTEVPKLVEAKRVSWVNLAMAIGTVIGVWAIVGLLTDVSGALEVIKGAAWAWVVLAFVLAQVPLVSNAWAITGAVAGPIPFGRCVALETSNMFTSLVGGDAAVFAVRCRFFQRQGFALSSAVSSGAIAGTASWMVKGVLFLISIGFAAGDFGAPTGETGDEHWLWLVIVIVLAVGVAGAVVALVPRLRRLLTDKARPHLLSMWEDVKTIATEPRKIVAVFGGTTVSQLAVALCLGASLHAVGVHLTLATIFVVLTLSAMIGGVVPVPGGVGVIEAGMIAGLTAAGVPESQAAAAVLMQRLWTAYLPPVWGWLTLVWMRRREYI